MKNHRSIALIAIIIAAPSLSRAALTTYWSFDGPTEADRLEESLGNTALDAKRVGGTSAAWNNSRGDGFDYAFAGGGGAAELSVTDGSGLDLGSGSFSFSIWSLRTGTQATVASGIFDALAGTGTGYQMLWGEEEIRTRIRSSSGSMTMPGTK